MISTFFPACHLQIHLGKKIEHKKCSKIIFLWLETWIFSNKKSQFCDYFFGSGEAGQKAECTEEDLLATWCQTFFHRVINPFSCFEIRQIILEETMFDMYFVVALPPPLPFDSLSNLNFWTQSCCLEWHKAFHMANGNLIWNNVLNLLLTCLLGITLWNFCISIVRTSNMEFEIRVDLLESHVARPFVRMPVV